MPLRIISANDPIDRSSFPEKPLWFFDFDGVLACQDEEKVFRLEEKPMERRRLIEMAGFMGIDHTLYPSTPYLRHLVIQGHLQGTPNPHREMLDFALELQEAGEPFFIITARSGLWAVHRLSNWLFGYGLLPQEVFCLGRSSKASLLATLREDWPDRPFVFFEDTPKHIDAAVALGDPDLHVVGVIWPTCTKNAEEIRRSHLSV